MLTTQNKKLALIEDSFSFLVERGYQVNSRELNRPYGDVAIVYQSPSCHLKIVTDQGEVYVFIAPNPLVNLCWNDLESVVTYLATHPNNISVHGSKMEDFPLVQIDDSAARKALASTLRRHLLAVEALFGQQDTKSLCEELRGFRIDMLKQRAGLN